MSSYAVKGEKYIFQVKFFDGNGDVIAVNTPSIEVYTFQSDGTIVALASGSMTEDTVETGRWTYPYDLLHTYSYQPVFYGLISAVDPSDGSTLRYEIEVAALEEDNGKGYFSVPEPPPPPSYRSHWNTADGNNGSQTVSGTISPTTTARIPTPSGGEGNPFKVGGTDGTNRTVTTSKTASFSTSQATSGFGGDSTMVVEIYDKDSLIDTFTTPAITQNSAHISPSGAITVTISQYGVDDALRYKAKAVVDIDVTTLLPNGGYYHTEITHNTDTTSDGGTYSFTQSEIFIDTDPSTPVLGALSFLESTPVYKYLSGIKYYDTNSSWRVILSAIDNLNANSIRTSANISISNTGYNLPNLNQSPFGSGSALFSGWTNVENNTGVTYDKNNWEITYTNKRYIVTNAGVSAFVRDPWNNSPTLTDNNHSILIDTFLVSSEDLFEPFNDENRRQDPTFNGGLTTGSWLSNVALVNGQALVQNGKLMIASTADYTNWSVFKPTGNPDYTGFSASADYYRTFVESGGLNQPNFIMIFSGTFVVNATSDLSNSLIEVFIRRVNSPNGDFGNTANPLTLHGQEYNQPFFDDGVTNGGIRLGASSGNTVQGTFGGLACRDGVYFHIRINDIRIKIDSVSITFPN